MTGQEDKRHLASRDRAASSTARSTDRNKTASVAARARFGEGSGRSACQSPKSAFTRDSPCVCQRFVVVDAPFAPSNNAGMRKVEPALCLTAAALLAKWPH